MTIRRYLLRWDGEKLVKDTQKFVDGKWACEPGVEFTVMDDNPTSNIPDDGGWQITAEMRREEMREEENDRREWLGDWLEYVSEY